MDAFGSLEVRWTQGFTNKCLQFVDNKTACYISGTHVCFLNLETKLQRVFQSPGRGVGVLTANCKNGIFAFSEQKLSPSIFVYTFPETRLKNELKGTAQLDYTSLTLSDGGPYLGSFSSLPDHTITVWNWEKAEPICTKPQAGNDVISLVFNPLNWHQLCALGTTSLTVWHVEKTTSFHVLRPSVIELPATDGSFVERLMLTSRTVTDKLPYFGPEMPPSAISGIRGDKAERILTKLCTKARLTPTAICWTTTSELYVGCEEGFLLLVEPERHSVSVLFNPTTADSIPELRQNNFLALTLHRNGLIAAGKESLVHHLQIKESHISITQTWQIEGPVTACVSSPDHKKLLLSSNSGQIYMLNPAQSDTIMKVLDVLSGDFVAAALTHTDKKICVSVRDSGQLQLWSQDGVPLGSLCLQTEVTGVCLSLACCPVAQYAAVGTSSGNVLFVDLNKEQQPRLVHQVHLYHGPLNHLVFDQEGHYLITGGTDSHLYVLHAAPSKRFSVIGFTVFPGPILSLSTQCIRDPEQVKVLALCSGQEGKNHDGNLLTVISLPARDLAGPGCADKYGCLSTPIIKMHSYEVPHPLTSCVLGVSEVFAYCHKKKTLQRFRLPKVTVDISGQEVVQLKPEHEVRGHPLGPASLVLSPHHLWLASVGRDGLLRIRQTASMDRCIELPCHSYRAGGVQSVSFSSDSQTLLTTGFKDGSLVCANLRFKGMGAGKVNEATLYSQSMDNFLKNILGAENRVLLDLPEWGQQPHPGTEKPEESQVRVETVEVTEQDESYHDLLSAPPSHPSWLESMREAVMAEEKENYSETKQNLKKRTRESRDTIQEMMRENNNLPVSERLEQHEFNLDVEAQKRLEAMVEQEVVRVRNEIEAEMLEKCYLRDALKRECWDCLKVKRKTIKAFHAEHEVKNYPMRERPEKELEDLRRVQNMRKLEMAACTQGRIKRSSNTISTKEEERGEEGHEAESGAETGCSSAQFGHSNAYIYDQYSLRTTEQKINQIILLQDVTYCIRTAFNADFEALHRQKVQQVRSVRERNRCLRRIMVELDMNKELWEPSLSSSEQPERLLTVNDSEIKAERYLTPEQEKEEERKKLEEQRRLSAKGDNMREKALDHMMDGVVEVEKEDILKREIPPPEFVLTKPAIHWTEEEKKAHKEYEKKIKALNEEKQKYKKLLEIEVKTLQATIKKETESFDESLKKLFEKKLKCEMLIYQEELKIAYLVNSVQIEEEMRNRELELKFRLEKTVTHKDELEEEMKRHEEEVELSNETYDMAVAKDKVLDKDFRKDFFDVPSHLVDQLYKLFKRRPRVQKTKADQISSIKEPRPCVSLAPSALRRTLAAMEELDAPENMPEGLNPLMWERFCLVRRTKVESEHKVKVNTVKLAEMQAFLQKRRDEEKAVQREIKHLFDELESLHKEKNHFLTNIMVQLELKQGQVEVSVTDLTADYADSALQHRSLVENLNRIIRTLGDQKIASMVERKDFRKGIIQLQWETKMLEMSIEDLNVKLRDIQMLRLSEEQKDYLNKTDEDSCMSRKVSILEKTIAFHEKRHQHHVQQCMDKIAQLKRQAAGKDTESAVVEEELPELQMAVAERKHVYETVASEEDRAAKAEKRYQEIIQKRDLKDLARTQAEELEALWEELECLRMKSFPSLDQLKHT